MGTKTMIPEPMHRIAPASVGSGISVRRLPACNFESIRKICQFYEEKGAGTYSHESRASRYLFDLSREVQATTRALEQTTRNREHQHDTVLQMYEAWNAVLSAAKDKFGVKTIMTPQMLLDMIETARVRIQQLESKQAELEKKHTEVESTISSSVDQQTVAVRRYFHLEMDSLKEKHRQELIDAEQRAAAALQESEFKMTAACRAVYTRLEREKAEWISDFKRQMARQASGHQDAAEQFRRTVDAMAAEQEAQRQHLKSALEAAELRHQQEIAKMRAASEKELLEYKSQHQQQLAAQAASVAADGDEIANDGLRQLLIGISEKFSASVDSVNSCMDATSAAASVVGFDPETHSQELTSLRDKVATLEHEATEMRKTVAAANRRCQVQEELLRGNGPLAEEAAALRQDLHFLRSQLDNGQASIDAAERVLEGQSRSQGAGQQLLPIQQQQLQQQQMLQQMLQQQACTGQAAMAIQRRNATFALPNSSVVGNSAELTLGHMFTARPRSS